MLNFRGVFARSVGGTNVNFEKKKKSDFFLKKKKSITLLWCGMTFLTMWQCHVAV